MLACYTDRLSVTPGETFALHASADTGPCALEIARIGAGREVVLRRERLAVGAHAVPAHADRDGCGWPAVTEIEVGADWASGYYDIQFTECGRRGDPSLRLREGAVAARQGVCWCWRPTPTTPTTTSAAPTPIATSPR